MPNYSPRQTVSYLMRRFQEVGLQPNSRHGQNFLVDLNLVRLLAESAEIGPDDVVLEVGTGTGSLTAMLAERAAAVVTVEIDERLYSMASDVLIDFDNVTMLQRDALKNKNRFDPKVLDTLRLKLSEHPGRRLKLAANLPYNVATPILSNLLSTDLPLASMTVTIQKELADRIIARPSTKDYGALSIWIQCQCDAQIVRVMPPSVFWPRPKVESAIIQIVPNAAKSQRIGDREAFHAFVRSMFFHRRKFLRSELISTTKGKLEKPDVDAIMAERGLTATARSEELEIEAMIGLWDAVHQRLSQV